MVAASLTAMLLLVLLQPCPALELALSGQSYSLLVGGKPWLQSAGPLARFFVKDTWLSSADGSLKLVANRTERGHEPGLGGFSRQVLHWGSAGGFEAQTNFKQYDSGSTVGFEQVFVTGINQTGHTGSHSDFAHCESECAGGDINKVPACEQKCAQASLDQVSSSFPSFGLAQAGSTRLGAVGWHGTFLDSSTDGPAVGLWPSGGVATGVDGGPLALFDPTGKDAIVLSAASQFMVASLGKLDNSSTLAAGLLGSVRSVPAGFVLSFIVSHSGSGLNNAMCDWGAKLLRLYGKDPESSARRDDFTNNYLGYNTDHGAFYYYNPIEGKDMAQTLLALQDYANHSDIPYRHVLLDSWWYFKGNGGGVANWTVRPDIFAGGGDAALKRFHEQTGWPIIGHNRYWSNNTPYAQQNGGQWRFSDAAFPMVVPLEQGFWDWLMSTSKEWGLYTYEQDWLYNEFKGVPLLTQTATAARTWLLQMGAAAEKAGLRIQYCMPYPRHALQSVEIGSVVQIRASDDYVPGKIETQWHLGSSAMLAHALALEPFKDNFWSSAVEPHSSVGNASDPDVVREACVATLSHGPVTPGDGIGFSDISLIKRSCRDDGLILKAARPATTIDRVFTEAVFGSVSPPPKIWSSYTVIRQKRWQMLFAAAVQQPFTVRPEDVTSLDPEQGSIAQEYLAFSLDYAQPGAVPIASLKVQRFDSLVLTPSTSSISFALWHFAPILDGTVVLLGELSKWVPVSSQRVADVQQLPNDGGLKVQVMGSPNETVKLSFAIVGGGQDFDVHMCSCCIPYSGSGQVGILATKRNGALGCSCDIGA